MSDNFKNIKYTPRMSWGVEELVSEPMVLKSNAGFYIGEMCWDKEYEMAMPYSRLSFEYYPTKSDAEKVLSRISKLRALDVFEEHGHNNRV